MSNASPAQATGSAAARRTEKAEGAPLVALGAAAAGLATAGGKARVARCVEINQCGFASCRLVGRPKFDFSTQVARVAQGPVALLARVHRHGHHRRRVDGDGV